MRSHLLALLARSWPAVRTLDPTTQAGVLGDVVCGLVCLPLAALSLSGLTQATPVAVFMAEWPRLGLLGGLAWLVSRQTFFIYTELRPGQYASAEGALDGVVTWSALLIFGPPALWLTVLSTLLDLAYNRRLLGRPASALSQARNAAFNIVIGVGGGLLAMRAYQAAGGGFPAAGFQLAAFGPVAAAVAVYLLVGGAVIVGYLLIVRALMAPEWQATLTAGVMFGFVLNALLLPALPLPFSVLAAALHTALGLGAYLFLLAGLWLVARLARQLSQASERSRQQARQLNRLEALGRALMVAPPDATALPDLLREHVPAMLPPGRLEIRLWPDRRLYHQPEDSDLLPEIFWEWWRPVAETRVFGAGAALPWAAAPDDSVSLIVLPIRDQASAQALGGLAYRMRRQLLADYGGAPITQYQPGLEGLAAQIASALRRAEVYAQALAHQKMTQELELAGRIQASFLPDRVPQLPGWQIAAGLDSARETSGDFFDFVDLPDGRLGLVVADVADKGTGAALYMALSRTLLRTFASAQPQDPAGVLAAVNGRLLADSRAEMFVTVFYGVLDPATGGLCYANAGHNPPLILERASGQLRAALRRTGPPLGALDDVTWRGETVTLAPGELLALYTDGVTEAANAAQAEYGESRLLAGLRAGPELPLRSVYAALRADVAAFVGGAPQSDDITLMLVARD